MKIFVEDIAVFADERRLWGLLRRLRFLHFLVWDSVQMVFKENGQPCVVRWIKARTIREMKFFSWSIKKKSILKLVHGGRFRWQISAFLEVHWEDEVRRGGWVGCRNIKVWTHDFTLCPLAMNREQRKMHFYLLSSLSTSPCRIPLTIIVFFIYRNCFMFTHFPQNLLTSATVRVKSRWEGLSGLERRMEIMRRTKQFQLWTRLV